MIDLLFIETGNGGDCQLVNQRFAEAMSFENMPYFAMFGGNPGEETTNTRLEDEQKFDWWGNTSLLNESKGAQFNSKTEFALNNEPLNSNGRKRIEEAVKSDLKFMQDFAEITVNVAILDFEKVQINIELIQPNNIQERKFIYIWDGFRLIDETISVIPLPSSLTEGLNEFLNYELT